MKFRDRNRGSINSFEISFQFKYFTFLRDLFDLFWDGKKPLCIFKICSIMIKFKY